MKDGERAEIAISGSVANVAEMLCDAMTDDEDDIIAEVLNAALKTYKRRKNNKLNGIEVNFSTRYGANRPEFEEIYFEKYKKERES